MWIAVHSTGRPVGGYAEEVTPVRALPRSAGDDLVAGDDPVLNRPAKVGKGRPQTADELREALPTGGAFQGIVTVIGELMGR
jgi:hypothetical protein